MINKKEINNKLSLLFKDFKKAGYFAKRNLACCRSCASYEIPDENENLYVYTTIQGDKDIFKEEYYKLEDIYLYWSAPNDDAGELCKIIRKNGFKVKKPTPDKAINIVF